MKQEQDRDPAGRRKPGRVYQPPKVTRVPIRIDEVMLAACKTSGGGGEYASCAVGCALPGS
jgi:hypothetical protein